MSARDFKSVYMVGGIAVAALGCYLVSLRVASERAALENVENRIVLAQRDIRLLSTEIGTRGRLSQLERWNVRVIRLSAPTADQFVESSFQLATLVKPQAKPAIEAPVVLASAPAPTRSGPVVTSDSGASDSSRPSRPLGEMMHVASYAAPAPRPSRLTARPVASPPVAKAAPATKSATRATADPLGPLSSGKSRAKNPATTDALASLARTPATPAKEPGARQ